MGINKQTTSQSELPDKEKHNGSSNKQLILQAILAEYQAVNTRVFNQIARYEDATIKTLLLVGALVTFYITQYKAEDPYLISVLNLICFIAFPVIAFGSLWLAFSDLIKVMILGDYLKIIENKVNDLLEEDHIQVHEKTGPKESIYMFPRGRVIDFEYWRIAHGHASRGNSRYELSYSFIVVTVTIIVCLYFTYVRAAYVLDNKKVEYYFWLWVFAGVFVLCSVITVRFLLKLFDRRKKTKENAINDLLPYAPDVSGTAERVE